MLETEARRLYTNAPGPYEAGQHARCHHVHLHLLGVHEVVGKLGIATHKGEKEGDMEEGVREDDRWDLIQTRS